MIDYAILIVIIIFFRVFQSIFFEYHYYTCSLTVLFEYILFMNIYNKMMKKKKKKKKKTHFYPLPNTRHASPRSGIKNRIGKDVETEDWGLIPSNPYGVFFFFLRSI